MNFLWRPALQEKKLDDSSRLDVVEIARRLTCFLSASVTRKDLQFGKWTDPFFQRHYWFRPTTSGSRSGQGLISTPSYFLVMIGVHYARFVFLRVVTMSTANVWNMVLRNMVKAGRHVSWLTWLCLLLSRQAEDLSEMWWSEFRSTILHVGIYSNISHCLLILTQCFSMLNYSMFE